MQQKILIIATNTKHVLRWICHPITLLAVLETTEATVACWL
jgi:hypothetical protein